MQGWRKRMEDSHISDLKMNGKGTHVFGVFDGHGGKEVAQYVKKYFNNELLNNNNFKSGNLKQALVDNFLKMDTMMQESTGKIELKNLAKISKQEDEKNNQNEKGNPQAEMLKMFFDPRAQEDCDIAMMTGCTATVCAIDEDNKKLYFANAGDSRIVLCKNGIAYPMSIDHKPDLDTEKNRIYKAEGFVTEGRVKGYLF
jgi:protein phosphatase 1G